MTNKELNTEYNLIIKNIVAPIFKRLGFKKSGTNFYRKTDDIIQVFNFQKNSMNIGNSFSFVGNIGFIEPETYLKLWKTDCLPKFPKCTDALIKFRLGEITHDGLDYWYNLRNDNRSETLIIQLQKDLIILENLFENHKTLLSLEKYFSDRTKILGFFGELGQFALFKKIGKDKVAKQILNKVYKKAKKPKSWTNFSTLANGIWKNKKSKPEVNKSWVAKIEEIAILYNEELK
jgi:hypothetical protein